jgi:transcription antitermination factor NusG
MTESRWYGLHAYSGYEKKVAENIMEQANKLGISQFIEEVSVPTTLSHYKLAPKLIIFLIKKDQT